MTTEQAYKTELEPHLLNGQENKEAWLRAWEIGLPTPKTEGFKKHNLTRLTQFTKGKPKGEMKLTHPLPSGIEMLPIKQATSSYSVFLQNLLKKTIQREKTPFALLNLACSDQGIFLYISKKTKEPLRIDDIIETTEGVAMKRLIVYVAKEASVDLVIERKIAEGSNTSSLIEIVVEEKGALRMVELDLNGNDHSSSLSHLRAQVKKGGFLQYFSAARGGEMSRNDLRVELLGEGSEVDLQGIYWLEAKREHHTDITVEHRATMTKSSQHFKGVLKGKSQATFRGKIDVDRIAQKTEAYQLSNHLILEKGAAAFSEPNLEIFADDVKASHGATMTQISDEELFYLRTRGIDALQAKELLMQGFTETIVKKIFDLPSKEKIRGVSIGV